MGFSSSIFSARKTADTTHANAQLFAPVWERSTVTNEQQWAQEHKAGAHAGRIRVRFLPATFRGKMELWTLSCAK